MKVESGESRIHGTGLFSKDTIEEGELVRVFEGTAADENDIHVLWYEEDDLWKGLSAHNELNFANHSKSPNVEVIGREMCALDET
jgi:sorbitol-specific phosphotransferase system component IIA